jgi:hypothetical protein|nr:MAG TPA: hypothetical protein [Caudoviricetes sp.]
MSKKKKIYIKAIATSLLKGAVLIAAAVGVAITLKNHMIISLLIAIAGAVCIESLNLLFNYLVDEYEKEL